MADSRDGQETARAASYGGGDDNRGGGATPPLQIGLDLTLVRSVEESLRRFGDRYRRRIFTDRELADTAGPGQAGGLAARFAAKEATMKALAPEDDALPWRSIEVARADGGRPILLLHREAEVLAHRRGLDHWTVSLTHEDRLAAAVVVAGRRCEPRPVTGAADEEEHR